MSRTTDDLPHRSCSRRRTSHAIPGRRHHTGLGTFGTTPFAPSLAHAQLSLLDVMLFPGTGATLYHRPGPHPQGKHGPKPLQDKRQRRLQAWAERTETPWKTVTVDRYRGQRATLWVFSHTALSHTPGLPPVEIRLLPVCDPVGMIQMEAFFYTDQQASLVQILALAVMSSSVGVTFAEARVQLGLETQRQWSDQAIARATLALFSLVTLLAPRLSQPGQIPTPVTP
jgi:hypothetical protein